MGNIFLSHSYILVFLPKSLFSITLILICITLSLITLLGNHFSFHFIALHYKRNVMSDSNNNNDDNNNNNNNNGIHSSIIPQSSSSSAGIQVISASDIGQAANTGEIPLLFSRSAVGSPVLG